MMSKIIIHNKTGLEDTDVLHLVTDIIKHGRISNGNKQYSYLTSYRRGETEYHIVTDLNKNSDTFTAYEVSKKNN